MKRLLHRALAASGDRSYNTINYYYLHIKNGVIPPLLDIDNPRTFNEKIIYLKMKYRYPEASKYADKLLVRGYVSQIVGTQYLIPLLGYYNSAADIDFSSLPGQFILKANHGSGWNILCTDKTSLDVDKVKKTLQKWLNTNYFSIGREYQYKDIKPRIIAEELLKPANGKEIKDYKIFCFGGEPKFIQVDVDRFTNHKRSYYDLNWNLLPFTILYPPFQGEIEQPESLSEMVSIARNLSKGFVFARIDLYSVGKKVYFGEITFHHEGGFGPILPRQYGRLLGDYLDLGMIDDPGH